MADSYTVSGSGPDLLLLHGWASSKHLWRRLLPELTAHFRCWAIDLPGFGRAEAFAGGSTRVQAYSDWLADFCDAHDITACGVAGHSMGGALTLQFAADQPERVKALAAINPVVTGRVILNALSALPDRARWMGWSQELSQTIIGPALASPVFDGVRELIWPVERRIDDFNHASGPALLDTWDLLTGFDVRPRLAAVVAPALIILGSLDINVPNSEGLSAAAELREVRVVRFTGGHTITDTYPRVVAELLRDFFQPKLAVNASKA